MLTYLVMHPDTDMVHIERYTGISYKAVRDIIHRLIGQGLITENNTDKRQKKYAPTDKGKDVHGCDYFRTELHHQLDDIMDVSTLRIIWEALTTYPASDDELKANIIKKRMEALNGKK